MTEMVERVAQAFAGLHITTADGSPVAPGDVARAAIEAMRRPTVEMALAGRPTSLYPGRTYAAMIDAALKRPTGPS